VPSVSVQTFIYFFSYQENIVEICSHNHRESRSHILYRHSMQQNAGEEPGNVDHHALIVKLGMWLALVQALTVPATFLETF